MDSDNDDGALYGAVGFVVVQWGLAEQSLDMLVAMLYGELGGKRFARRLPKMLEPKLHFLRACFSGIPALGSLKLEAELLVTEFDRLSGTRHDLIHGAVASLSTKHGAILFSKLDIKDDIHHLRKVQLKAADFPVLAKDLVGLGTSTASLANKVFDLSPGAARTT